MSKDIETLKSLLTLLARDLVTEPDELVVNAEERDHAIVLTLTCNPADLGKVIGRAGRRAQTMRTIVKAKGNQIGRRVIVDISDKEEN